MYLRGRGYERFDFFFSSRRRHTRFDCDWSSDVCSSNLVRYLTAVTPAQREAFDSAAAQWERLIYGDVPDELASFPAGTCGPGTPVINEIIDDIIIYVQLDSIDGPGKILGQAGPCLLRDQSFQPGVGVMHFDTADVAGLLAAGQLDEVVRHTTGHVLGFGTIWPPLGLPPVGGGTDPHV